jgi:hypothetical protein
MGNLATPRGLLVGWSLIAALLVVANGALLLRLLRQLAEWSTLLGGALSGLALAALAFLAWVAWVPLRGSRRWTSQRNASAGRRRIGHWRAPEGVPPERAM